MEWSYGEYELTDDRWRVDLEAVSTLLRDTYWAGSRSRDRIALSIRNSLCFSLFHRSRQVGIARVLTDQGATSYLCDFVIEPEYRSRGLGSWVMERILGHPAVEPTHVLLITRDAQSFYRKLGFVTHPYECMVKAEPESHASAAEVSEPRTGGTDSPR